ncbi:MAG TPA: MCP four helix bundle domain-containing protein, partial [Bacteroidota bacterium]|nr:MCP four helix bundle domain-containing protein [Bacteroidota bacterium]
MQWFYDLRIGTKLISAFVLVAIIAAFVGYEGVTSLQAADDSDTILFENNTMPLSYSGDLSASFHRMRANLIFLINAKSAEERKDYTQRISDRRADIEKAEAAFSKTIITDDVRNAFAELTTSRKEFLKIVDNVVALTSADRLEEAATLLKGDGEKGRTRYQKNLDALNELVKTRARNRSDENTVLADRAMHTMLIITGFGFIISLGLGFFISRLISRPLTRGVEMMKELNQGHITARLNITTKDEVGVLAQTMDEFAGKLQSKVVAVMDNIAHGVLTDRVDTSDKDDAISPALYNIIASLQGLIAEAGMLTQAALDGRLETRGNAAKFQGGYSEIVDGVNKTLDAVILPVKEGSDVLSQMAKNDFTVRMEGEYKGDHQLLKNSINQLGESLSRVLFQVSEAVSATASASNQISSSTEEMAAGAQEQTQQATEVAGAVEQMTKTIIDTTKNAGDAASIAKHAGETAVAGGQVVDDTVAGMNRIAD